MTRVIVFLVGITAIAAAFHWRVFGFFAVGLVLVYASILKTLMEASTGKPSMAADVAAKLWELL